jgi:hypothetical protein
VNEDEDLELAALQRQLDDAFETTRPRRGFEDELWLRMQQRRPLWRRLGDGLSGLIGGIREAPGVPAAAVASVLIVLIGAGVVISGGLHFGGGGASSTAGSAPFMTAGSQYNGSGAQASAFGLLPPPALTGSQPSPTQRDQAPDTVAAPKTSSSPGLYFGPATLTWAGTLDVTITAAPVYRYQEPSEKEASQFATSLGASGTGRATPGYFGPYSGQGFTVSIRGSDAQAPSEPFYVLAPSGSGPSTPGATATDIANAYLSSHSLVPQWPSKAVAAGSTNQAVVELQRLFVVGGGTTAKLVDGSGQPYGIEVDISNGRPARVAGPLPIGLQSADYRIISADQAVSSALASGPAGAETITPRPAVRLTTAELVYALVVSGDHGFYEPCFLFSGTFDYNGVKYTKRVLVPAVDPAYRSP